MKDQVLLSVSKAKFETIIQALSDQIVVDKPSWPDTVKLLNEMLLIYDCHYPSKKKQARSKKGNSKTIKKLRAHSKKKK